LDRVSNETGFTSMAYHRQKSQSNTVRSGDLWHKRLGHPSKEIMKIFANNSVFLVHISENKDVCDTCFRAKQTRNQFSLSERRATKLFETIHFDIEGPYRVSSSYEATIFLL